MAIERIRIDYTVYSPNYKPGEGLCLGFDTFQKAKARAIRLGAGARVYRNFNQRNKRGQVLGDWWTATITGFGMAENSGGYMTTPQWWPIDLISASNFACES